MRAKMLLFALPALVCRAQDATLVGLPEYGVILTGTPAAPRPVIVDGRHKSILGYTINRIGAAGFELVVTRNFRLNQDWDIGIPGSTPSGNRAVQNSGPITPGMPTAPAMQGEGVPVKAVLELVVFDNGEVVGADPMESAGRFARRINAERTLAQYVLTRPANLWNELNTLAFAERFRLKVRDNSTSIADHMAQMAKQELAYDLIQTRDKEGERGCV